MAQDEAGGRAGCGCLILILSLIGGCVECCDALSGDYDSYLSPESGARTNDRLFSERDWENRRIPTAEVDFPSAGATK
ncbi:MAG: hypothetical protein IKU86_05825 [Thermoguttaceae bacterium]|nr:hypothetical protein [Thermoguttaceae bacterium]